MNKPSIFVGSSDEGLEVARAVQVQLSDIGEVELWNEGVFRLSAGTLESHLQALNRFDFSVLVLTPDDITMSRGIRQNSSRDNVLIEIGLFIGSLGRERTFMLYCTSDNIKIPSDLAGITFATFDMPSDVSKLIPAVGPACVLIRNAIRRLGRREELGQIAQTVETQEQRLQAQGSLVAAQQEQLEHQQNIINKIVLYSMSHLIFQHLAGIHHAAEKGGEYLFQGNLDAFRRDLRFLRDHGYLHHFHVNELQDGQNLATSLRLTPNGLFYVELREEFERQQKK